MSLPGINDELCASGEKIIIAKNVKGLEISDGNINVEFTDSIEIKNCEKISIKEAKEISVKLTKPKSSQESLIPSIPNFRELGGYKACNNKIIKHSVFFRSSHLSQLKGSNDINNFKNFGIKIIFDLRNINEIKQKPDPTFDNIKSVQIESKGTCDSNQLFVQMKKAENPTEVVMNYFYKHYEGYKNMCFDNPAFKIIFKEIVNGNVPILIHCAGGKDRTGVICALILAFFGVDRETIVLDYLKSAPWSQEWIDENVTKLKQYVSPEVAEIMKSFFGCSSVYIEMALNTILFKYGSYDKYFEAEYGISPQKRQEIITKYTE